MNFLKKLFGSSSEKEQPQAKTQPQAQQPPQPAPVAQGDGLEKYRIIPWMTDMRLQNVSICLAAGFKPASSLPTQLDRELRPAIEIAKRLNAIKSLVLWLMVPEDHLPNEVILNFVATNDLAAYLAEDEMDILHSSRRDMDARNALGWKFENAWSLAWYFGYPAPEITGIMMTGEQMQEILMNFSCPLNQKIEDWVLSTKTATEEELLQKEDLFYCLHNAVRSAQMGNPTVPPDFDPRLNGGVIHERRHALTWMVSSGVSWDSVDLST